MASMAGHGTLDAVGLIPGPGELADGINGLWYAAEGNAVDSSLSFAGMLPFAGWAATGGKVLRHADEASLAQRIMSAERTGSGLKADASHRAASFLSEAQLEAGTSFTIRGGDDIARELLQTPGGMNGSSGIFEYILDPTKGVTHQRFIPGGGITGTPNQVVPR
jgi:hypothetical protein